jgi:subtilisin family serine protease
MRNKGVRRTIKIGLALAFALAICKFQDAHAELRPERGEQLDAEQPFEPPRRIIIKPKKDMRERSFVEFEARKGAKTKKRYPAFGDLRVIEVPEGTTAAKLVEEFKQSGLVEYAEIEHKVYSLATPNDLSFGTQWGLHNTGQSGGTADADIDAPEAWDIRTSATNIIVAIVDSGANLAHEDLASNLWVNSGEIAGNGLDDDSNGFVDDVHGINAIVPNGNPADDAGHGTHVAGIIGARGNNSKGGAGVAWQVRLMPLKFIGSDGSGDLFDAIECLDYAIEEGAHIVNASWGSSFYSQALHDAIAALRTSGILFVTAAGNDGHNTDQSFVYPAGYKLDNIVTVGASTRTNTLAYFSSYGYLAVDLAAPGADICSTYGPDTDEYANLSGTSMAAPHVAGAFALMKAHAPSETYLGLINRMLATVETGPSYRERVRSGGVLNLKKALDDIVATAPANNNFSSRITLTGRFATGYGRNTGASKETGEPSHAGNAGGKSVWWTWTAPSSGTYEFTTAGSFSSPGTPLNTLLAIYTGTAVNSLTTIASNNDSSIVGDGTTTSRLTFNATGGTTYQIAVDGSGGAGGYIRLSIASVPVNDNLASAFKLNGSYVGLRASNLGATKQTSENSHGGDAGGRSVWWTWTAPLSGTFVLTTIGSDFDTTLGVYTGSSFALTSVASNNDDADVHWKDQYGGKTSAVTFSATEGQVYHFAVDGYQGAAGNIVLAGTYRHSINLPNTYYGSPTRINNANYVAANSGSQPRRYELDASTVSLGPNNSVGVGLSDLGKIAGQSNYLAMLWTPPSTVWIDPDTAYTSYAVDVNDNGFAVGAVWNQICGMIANPIAHYWSNGVKSALPAVGTGFSMARSINHLNEAVGFGYRYQSSCSAVTNQAALWEIESDWIQSRTLPSLGGIGSSAGYINKRGEIIGGSHLTGGTAHPTLWVDSEPRDLVGMGNGSASLAGINNRSLGAGLAQTSGNFYQRAVLWQNDVFIDINKIVTFTPNSPFYWTNLYAANSVNDYGRIVGSGEAWEAGWWMPYQFMFIATPPTNITIFDPTLLANNQFQLTVRGTSGITCTIQACTDLVAANWSNIGSVVLSGGTATYTDAQATNYTARFYRVYSGSKRSENVVGYHIRTIPSGFSMIANPFVAKDNRLAASMATAPWGSIVYQWSVRKQSFTTTIADDLLLGWTDEQATLEPGESALFYAPTNFVWKCFGDVRQNVATHTTPTGFSLQSSSAPLAGAVTTVLGFQPSQGDKVLKNVNSAGNAYDEYVYSNGAWSPSVPTVVVGEGFWVYKAFGEPWVQNYSAW